ncbi:unnamed protein product [Ixodes pacificus]
MTPQNGHGPLVPQGQHGVKVWTSCSDLVDHATEHEPVLHALMTRAMQSLPLKARGLRELAQSGQKSAPYQKPLDSSHGEHFCFIVVVVREKCGVPCGGILCCLSRGIYDLHHLTCTTMWRPLLLSTSILVLQAVKCTCE